MRKNHLHTQHKVQHSEVQCQNQATHDKRATMYLHAVLASTALFALTTTLSLPHPTVNRTLHPPSSDNPPINLTQPRPPSWPPTPFIHPLSPSATISITSYGRSICGSRVSCRSTIRTSIVEIGWRLSYEYKAGAGTAYSWTNGDVNFVIHQERETEVFTVLMVLHVLYQMTEDYGPTEVVSAGIVDGAGRLARFMMTFTGF